MKSRRRIVVNDRVWYYRIGTNWCVAKAEDTGEGQKINLSELTGVSWSEIERGTYKGYFHVTPKQVAEWLKQFEG